MLNAPGMGGAVVFPQLELGVNVPRGSLLHWRTRSAGGSSSEWDYRSGQAICPVLLGVQLYDLGSVRHEPRTSADLQIFKNVLIIRSKDIY
ncbi:GD17013 [Drosophila simulans]|uniref:GD17013 n=1 Tax=Drosophila simulans TaxID=7240 RepID=B4R265_DROSI|nr:GD17013 [Drosophila simulans]